jgi:oxygen-independent coproporphyrinogen-3 oxidase
VAQQPEGIEAPADGLLPESARLGSDSRTFHAYLHIPFCTVRCGYCDFNTYTATELPMASQAEYPGVLASEIAFSQSVIKRSDVAQRKLSTVFFGGGTPTLLAAERLAETLVTLRETFGFTDGVEITTEANPDTLSREYIETLARAGVTRVSLGMQSAVSEVLAALDRSHNPEMVGQAVAWAREAGLQVSVDLIYGAPGETIGQWQQSVETAISYEPDHISAYALIVEDGTKLARQIRSGELEAPDPDLEADKYLLADEAFEAAGFKWYELSNWSRTTETRSRHNVAYWQGMDWWGYGPGAHSHIGGVRWWNAKHPTAYAQRLALGSSPAVGREILDEATRLTERVLLESRLFEGLDLAALRTQGWAGSQAVAGLIADGLVEGQAAVRGRLVLTKQGRLLADHVVRQLT